MCFYLALRQYFMVTDKALLWRQGEVGRLRSEHETFATRSELGEQESRTRETLSMTESQIVEVEQRVSILEQDGGTRVGGLSGTVCATLTL